MTCWKLAARWLAFWLSEHSDSLCLRGKGEEEFGVVGVFFIAYCFSLVNINGDNIQKQIFFQANLPSSINVSNNLTYHVAFHQSILRKSALAISCYILYYIKICSISNVLIYLKWSFLFLEECWYLPDLIEKLGIKIKLLLLLLLAIISIFFWHIIRLILAWSSGETWGKGVPTSAFRLRCCPFVDTS